MNNTRYPGYDVLGAREEWDEHTRSVIDQRLQDPGPLTFFSEAEATALKAAIARLLADDDPWRGAKVLEHIDTTVGKGPGDNYRQVDQPPDQEMWRQIVAALGDGFAGLAAEKQDQRLRDMQQSQKQHFKALLKESVSGYCSLPPVWSFMGYGGPAFPRGYVRIELGLVDPWEAKQQHEA